MAQSWPKTEARPPVTPRRGRNKSRQAVPRQTRDRGTPSMLGAMTPTSSSYRSSDGHDEHMARRSRMAAAAAASPRCFPQALSLMLEVGGDGAGASTVQTHFMGTTTTPSHR